MTEPYPPTRRLVGALRALRALPLDPGLRLHEDPTAPRLIERWDGIQWVLHAMAPDRFTVCDSMYVPPPDRAGRHCVEVLVVDRRGLRVVAVLAGCRAFRVFPRDL